MIYFLSLFEFRNFSECSIQFSPKINVFLGNNGQGKSNLLESLSLATQGESFRFFENRHLIKNNKSSSYINVEKKIASFDFKLQAILDGNVRNHKVNGKKTSSISLKKNFLNVIFSPESLEIIKASSEKRRVLIDDLLVSVDPNKTTLLSDFRKCLRMRNRVLMDFSKQKVSREKTLDILEAINPKFLELSCQITIQRILALKNIIKEFNAAMQYISKQTNFFVSIEYIVSGQNIFNLEDSDIWFLIKKRLIDLHEAELTSGISLVGPHRHDIKFLFDNNDSRFFCSQGQQRAMILSFKMAQIVYHRQVHGTYPVLMLDDVLSEFDMDKRNSLIAFLSELNTQIFITTTDLNLSKEFGRESCNVIRVHEGKIV